MNIIDDRMESFKSEDLVEIGFDELQKLRKTLKHRPRHVIRNKEQKNIPACVRNTIQNLRLHTLEDHDLRARLFIEKLFRDGKTLKTIERYYSFAKSMGIFGESTIVVNRLGITNSHGAIEQVRIVDYVSFISMIKYLQKEPPTKLSLSIQFAYYTCLRIGEILQLKISHLVQLLETQRPAINIDIVRKNDMPWVPIIFNKFLDFLRICETFYVAEITLFKEYNEDSLLFAFCKRSLQYGIRTMFRKAVGVEAAKGFGFHSIRYLVGTFLAKQGNLEYTRRLLGHRHLKTTYIYLKIHERQLDSELQQFLETNDFYKQLMQMIKTDVVTVNEINQSIPNSTNYRKN